MKIIQLLALLLLSFSLPASANTDKNEAQLVLSSCISLKNAPSDSSTKACTYYIQGFLAGALNTSYQYKIRESAGGFSDRAYQTRVGNETSKKQITEVCIPTKATRDQLIERIVGRTVEQLPASADSLLLLHSKIYQALSAELPCE
ncbi:hypothetical protein LMH66_07695 [Shewanella sp. 10N.7]|uniref:Rap1a/Tai family immunity protein n=1 Tax=Shewanella sp. 10N.7 TaxID=2885093 RepID=UPI001E501A11|nr:Rap1a/Tai family immunity protein [Shewanella sp. 10N.7]MCC4832512.1 hypothetical protein [Shewanella sp. 10N.7]